MDTPISRAKESWMEPLQPTVRQGVVQMKDFIMKLVDIEEKEGKDSTTHHGEDLCASLLLDPAYRPPCPPRLSLSGLFVVLFRQGLMQPRAGHKLAARNNLKSKWVLWPPAPKG